MRSASTRGWRAAVLAPAGARRRQQRHETRAAHAPPRRMRAQRAARAQARASVARSRRGLGGGLERVAPRARARRKRHSRALERAPTCTSSACATHEHAVGALGAPACRRAPAGSPPRWRGSGMRDRPGARPDAARSGCSPCALRAMRASAAWSSGAASAAWTHSCHGPFEARHVGQVARSRAGG